MINREIDFDLKLSCQYFYYSMAYFVGFNKDLRKQTSFLIQIVFRHVVPK